MVKHKYFLFILFSLILLTLFEMSASEKFDYTLFDNVLKKYVIGNKVNYKGLVTEKEKLFTFINKLAQNSPDSNPDMFQTKNARLAYWINAYNAYILKTIVESYPVESIKDINFIGVTIWLNKNILGREKVSFKSLEDDIIRNRFNDPRIHFAINCASTSCPPLLNEAYIPEKLDKQLDKSTADFINNKNNFLIEEKDKIIHLSAIFDWYEDDFIKWLTENDINLDEKEPNILDYLKLYYSNQFYNKWYDYDIEIMDYDWSLNE